VQPDGLQALLEGLKSNFKQLILSGVPPCCHLMLKVPVARPLACARCVLPSEVCVWSRRIHVGIAKAPGAKVLLAVPPPMANVAAPQPSNHCLSSSRLPMVLHPINQQSSTDQSAVAYAMGKRRPGNLPTPEIENTWWESCIELLYWRQLLCCGMEDRLRLAPVCMCVLQNWPSNEGFLRCAGPPSENGAVPRKRSRVRSPISSSRSLG
jgi:hypothetical protein